MVLNVPAIIMVNHTAGPFGGILPQNETCLEMDGLTCICSVLETGGKE